MVDIEMKKRCRSHQAILVVNLFTFFCVAYALVCLKKVREEIGELSQLFQCSSRVGPPVVPSYKPNDLDGEKRKCLAAAYHFRLHSCASNSESVHRRGTAINL
jgi:hypothetical protein